MGRLYFLQVIKGNYYRLFSNENSIKDTKIAALRGMIYDRNDKIMVDNRPSFDVVIVRQYMTNKDKVINTLSGLIDISREEIRTQLEKGSNLPVYYPIVIKDDVTREEVAKIQSRQSVWYTDDMDYDLRGVEVLVRYARTYWDGEAASHTLGYVTEIDRDRLEKYRKKYPGRYSMGDEVGVYGLEERLDDVLRGKNGFEQNVVNAFGREIHMEGLSEELVNEDCQHGKHVKLTIDRDLQVLAKNLMKDREGAVVALNPNDGGIYVMYSAPSFNLNKLSKARRDKYWEEISSDERKYLLDRTLQAAYPPASTYKIVTAAAALSEGVVKPTEKIYCPGHLLHGRRKYHCWNKKGHGSLAIVDAIEQSCDVFFYTMGLRLGVDKLAEYAHHFYLGRSTGIDIPIEKTGLIPTSSWKEKRFKERWYSGETVSAAIGQSYDLMTPLQGAMMIATVANGGRKIKPHFVQEISDINGAVVEKFEYKSEDDDFPISKDVMKLIKEGVVNVVHGDAGTARRLKWYSVPMAGKTGTAQVVSLKVQEENKAKRFQDHAWFVGFAPIDKPEIAVAVLVEHGGHGSSAAAPVAGEIMQRFFELKNK